MSKLKKYEEKRHFDRTPEPEGKTSRSSGGRTYVVQKHAASRLHYDFRLEWGGVLKSWAVPKGPSLDPADRSLAVYVEDHPVQYAQFEGIIPAGQYGGGTVMLWDRGTWQPEGDPEKAYRRGKLSFQLFGQKLKGRWSLVRMHGRDMDDQNWLLIKSSDEYARDEREYDVLTREPRSIASGRLLDEIAQDKPRIESAGEADEPLPSPIDLASAGLRKRPLPKSFAPQLATASTQSPAGPNWLHELKFDGYRMLARLESGQVELVSRTGKPWTDRFPTVAAALKKFTTSNTILDGEIVVLEKDGTTNFQALQNLLSRGRDNDVKYFVFDIPYLDGYDLTPLPLVQRKQLLNQFLQAQPAQATVRYSDHIAGDGKGVFSHACRRALEGIISKRIDSPYQQRRSEDWLKIKCLKRQEFVVGGWTEPGGSRQGFGALLVGYYEQKNLHYAGRVGTGFNSQSLRDVKQQLDSLATLKSPFAEIPAGVSTRGVHWVKPNLVVEVEFNSWTDEGLVRQGAFQGIREDKPAKSIVREVPIRSPHKNGPSVRAAAKRRSSAPVMPSLTSARRHTTSTNTESSEAEVAGVRLTNPDRVLYPGQGITKRELAEYYASVSDWILPHLVGRPMTLVRCPRGRTGHCFYQKHLTESMPDTLEGVEIEEKGATRTYVVLYDLTGLISLVQMSVLELHPWPARDDQLERPDQLVFDLDPAEDVDWNAVVEAAREVRDRLQSHNLKSFVRTSGGKGVHVVAPIARQTTWENMKAFAKRLATEMAQDQPDRYVATASKAKRQGKVFIDYLRNQRGATAVASYSTRAKPGAPVAAPIRWDELNARMRPDKYHVRNLRKRLTSLADDPWNSFFDLDQQLPS